MKALQSIQQELQAPKNLYNSFGKYKYRSCEGILEAVKPLLWKYNALLTISDDLHEVCGRVYVTATATIAADGEVVTVTASAQDSGSKSGMDAAQVTGAASSYARKYALNGLFLIDDTKDVDTEEYQAAKNKPVQSKPVPEMRNSKTPQERAREYLLAHPAQLEALLNSQQYSHVGDIDMFTSSEMLDIYNRMKIKGLVL